MRLLANIGHNISVRRKVLSRLIPQRSPGRTPLSRKCQRVVVQSHSGSHRSRNPPLGDLAEVALIWRLRRAGPCQQVDYSTHLMTYTFINVGAKFPFTVKDRQVKSVRSGGDGH